MVYHFHLKRTNALGDVSLHCFVRYDCTLSQTHSSHFMALKLLDVFFIASYLPYPLQQESYHISQICRCMSEETQGVNAPQRRE